MVLFLLGEEKQTFCENVISLQSKIKRAISESQDINYSQVNLDLLVLMIYFYQLISETQEDQ